MGLWIRMTQLGPREAVTVSHKLKSAVDDCVEQFGKPRVSAEVVDAAAYLLATASALPRPASSSETAKRELEAALGHCLGAIECICDQTIEMYCQSLVPLSPEQTAEYEAARALQETLFSAAPVPWSPGATNYRSLTELLLSQARQPAVQKQLALLGLTQRFALLGALSKRLGPAPSKPSSEAQAYTTWQSALESYLTTVLAKHKSTSELRQRLLEPYQQMAQALRSARRRGEPMPGLEDDGPE